MNPPNDAAWEAYTAWVRQFARDYAAACRNNPRYQLSEHTHDFDEAQELYDIECEEMGWTHQDQFAAHNPHQASSLGRKP